MPLPGVNVGPLDPEATKDFGQVAANRSARRLIRLHVASMPPDLQRALAKVRNEPRSRALQLDEVRDALGNVEGAVPDGHVVVGASIRGTEDDPDKSLCYTFVHTDQGKARSVKWFVPLADVADDLTDSMELGDRLAVIDENKQLGIVSTEGPPYGGEGSETSLRRKVDDLKRRNDELSRKIAERDAERVDDSEPGGVEPPSDEPWEGYDGQTADDIAEQLREADQDTRDRVAEYEAANKDRKSVMAVAERTDHPEE